MAARPIKLPISIMSGNILWLQPFNFSTPSIEIKLEPIPLILAPMLFSILHSCWRYGSQAALYIVVLPFAKTAVIIIFAVPVTEASSSNMFVPFN